MEGEVRADQRVTLLNTRHQVVFRWTSGKCKSFQFDFSEMVMDSEAFTKAFDKAVDDAVNSETERAWRVSSRFTSWF
jgi:hypothetical protein